MRKVLTLTLLFGLLFCVKAIDVVVDDEYAGSMIPTTLDGFRYVTTDQLMRIGGSSRSFDAATFKESMDFLRSKVVFSMENPFITIDGEVYNLGLPTRLEPAGFFVPLTGFFECFSIANNCKLYISADSISLKKTAPDLKDMLSNKRKEKQLKYPNPKHNTRYEISSFDNRSNSSRKKTKLIVIDPGHGGRDPGAIGLNGTYEKVITLTISKKLKVELEKLGYQVVLTRTGDVFIPLARRTRMANKLNADLFVSVHCNASPSRNANGLQVFYLSPAKTDDARTAAALENKSLLLEDNPIINNLDELAYIMTDMMQSEFQRESSILAYTLEKELTRKVLLRARGPAGAGFYVLYGTFMPAVLIETAFISNPDEEKLLKTDMFKQKVAQAVAIGIDDFMGNINW